MIATIIKITKKSSRYGGFYYLLCFKNLKVKSYISYIYEKMRNFSRWKKVLKEGITLKGLKLVRGKNKLIDADSRFKIIEEG